MAEKLSCTIFRLEYSSSNINALQDLFTKSPSYFLRSGGEPARHDEGQKIFDEIPPDISVADKYVFGSYYDNELIGCADIVNGFPDESRAYIGLLLIAEDRQGEGFGRMVYSLLELEVKKWSLVSTIRLAVVRSNSKAIPFWLNCGFHLTGEVRPFKFGRNDTEALLMEKQL